MAPHPSLKPKSFLRQIVYTALPLGEGIVADPFMGSGSTVAAAEAVGVQAIGVERFRDYFEVSREAVPKLASLDVQNERTSTLRISFEKSRGEGVSSMETYR